MTGFAPVSPEARIVHAFASTEAGFAFEVDDGQAGFPARLLDECGGRAALRVVGGSLQVRSPGAASHYLGPEHQQIAGVDGFVDTGDILEARGDRYHFVGRRDGMINVGGLKVHPEEVEAVLNAHPDIRMARVMARPNPFTGAVVMAEVVVDDSSGRDEAAIERELYAACREFIGATQGTRRDPFRRRAHRGAVREIEPDRCLTSSSPVAVAASAWQSLEGCETRVIA